MSMIVGYDCEMTPLRVNDKVIILQAKLDHYKGIITSVRGLCPHLGVGFVGIDIPCNHPVWRYYYSIRQENLKKVDLDFESSLTELIDNLKENTHEQTTNIR